MDYEVCDRGVRFLVLLGRFTRREGKFFSRIRLFSRQGNSLKSQCVSSFYLSLGFRGRVTPHNSIFCEQAIKCLNDTKMGERF